MDVRPSAWKAVAMVMSYRGPGLRRNRYRIFSPFLFSGAEADKWDNHNAIARGWRDANGEFYHPVTFRKLYAVAGRK